MLGIGKIISWYFVTPLEPRPFLQIVAWWEIRRIPYNLLIAFIGIPSFILFAMFIAASNKLQPGDDVVEPMALLLAPVAFNICYTLGEIIEIILGQSWKYQYEGLATSLMKSGTAISLAIVLFPSVFWGSYLLLLKLGIAK